MISCRDASDGREASRILAHAARPHVVDGDVPAHAQKPGVGALGGQQSGRLEPHAQQHLLRDVLGLRRVIHEAEREGLEPPAHGRPEKLLQACRLDAEGRLDPSDAIHGFHSLHRTAFRRPAPDADEERK